MPFFLQAEDGIRDADVTGVQTCALPISCPWRTCLCPCLYLCAAAASSISLNEFDVGYVQHQFFRSLALRGEKAMQLDLSIQARLCQQPGLGFKRDPGDFGIDPALCARLVPLRFMPQAEFDCGNARRGVAQAA